MITELRFEYPINKVFAIGQSIDLKVRYSPASEEVNLTYSTENEDVISLNGNIATGLAFGSARVFVTDSISGLTDAVNISIVSEEDYTEILCEINENMMKGYRLDMKARQNLALFGKDVS